MESVHEYTEGVWDDYLWIVICGCFAAFFMAFGIGANDVANSFGSSVAARTLTLRQALIVASVCEFAGSVLLGGEVTATVAGGIARLEHFDREPEVYMYGMLVSLTSAGLWLLAATYMELPVSTTHSIIGAVIGFALVYGGGDAVIWVDERDEFPYMGGVVPIVLAWLVSPLLSGIATALLFFLIRMAILRRENSLVLSYWLLPVLVLGTIWINVFFVLNHGAQRRLSWSSSKCAWVAGAIAGGCALVAAVLALPAVRLRVASAVERRYRRKEAEREAAEHEKGRAAALAAAAALGLVLASDGPNMGPDPHGSGVPTPGAMPGQRSALPSPGAGPGMGPGPGPPPEFGPRGGSGGPRDSPGWGGSGGAAGSNADSGMGASTGPGPGPGLGPGPNPFARGGSSGGPHGSQGWWQQPQPQQAPPAVWEQGMGQGLPAPAQAQMQGQAPAPVPYQPTLPNLLQLHPGLAQPPTAQLSAVQPSQPSPSPRPPSPQPTIMDPARLSAAAGSNASAGSNSAAGSVTAAAVLVAHSTSNSGALVAGFSNAPNGGGSSGEVPILAVTASGPPNGAPEVGVMLTGQPSQGPDPGQQQPPGPADLQAPAGPPGPIEVGPDVMGPQAQGPGMQGQPGQGMQGQQGPAWAQQQQPPVVWQQAGIWQQAPAQGPGQWQGPAPSQGQWQQAQPQPSNAQWQQPQLWAGPAGAWVPQHGPQQRPAPWPHPPQLQSPVQPQPQPQPQPQAQSQTQPMQPQPNFQPSYGQQSWQPYPQGAPHAVPHRQMSAPGITAAPGGARPPPNFSRPTTLGPEPIAEGAEQPLELVWEQGCAGGPPDEPQALGSGPRFWRGLELESAGAALLPSRLPVSYYPWGAGAGAGASRSGDEEDGGEGGWQVARGSRRARRRHASAVSPASAAFSAATALMASRRRLLVADPDPIASSHGSRRSKRRSQAQAQAHVMGPGLGLGPGPVAEGGPDPWDMPLDLGGGVGVVHPVPEELEEGASSMSGATLRAGSVPLAAAAEGQAAAQYGSAQHGPQHAQQGVPQHGAQQQQQQAQQQQHWWGGLRGGGQGHVVHPQPNHQGRGPTAANGNQQSPRGGGGGGGGWPSGSAHGSGGGGGTGGSFARQSSGPYAHQSGGPYARRSGGGPFVRQSGGGPFARRSMNRGAPKRSGSRDVSVGRAARGFGFFVRDSSVPPPTDRSQAQDDSAVSDSHLAGIETTFQQLKAAVLRGTTTDVHRQVLAVDDRAAAIHAHAEVFDPATEHVFKYLQIITAICDSFSHGANDVANAAGPLTAIWYIWKHERVDYQANQPVWILALGGAGIVVGLAMFGYHIIRAIGLRLSVITPSRGFCIELSTALVVVVASNYGMPISTTHCQVGSTAAMGLMEGSAGLNWVLLLQFFMGWAVTLAITGLICAAIFAVGVFSPCVQQGQVIVAYQDMALQLAEELNVMLNRTNYNALSDNATWGNYSADLAAQIVSDMRIIREFNTVGDDRQTRPVQHLEAHDVAEFLNRTINTYLNNSVPYIGGQSARQRAASRP
ncbi:hypothetical protein HYH03_009593 [Edaphochlamys debaryana]|uniref:Phosphate transporter n=1 Tax=Edaphochlamys debaryana TaxID=47281 RepID=A0A836BXL3_9CHLO|nr:hypothetical protein HYH03_009593 [Edaphochlamys debaryana]|eukprot:KAG2492102.1 hypothetical protein HYH03_009593 [Edaphochlamys debaryana]